MYVCMYSCFDSLYVCAPSLCLVLKEARKRVLNFLRLELQTVLSYHMDDGNGALALRKSSQCFQMESHSPGHKEIC